MGLLVNGKWLDKWYDTKSSDGEFRRESAQLRQWVTVDGNAGAEFPAESGRYHLYVSLACPWAHRTLIFRKLKKLEEHISVSIVSTDMLESGWTFNTNQGSSGDPINHANYLYEIYIKNNPTYSGRVTVPVLWDKQKNVIINNESSEIIRMFNTAFNAITHNQDDYYPVAHRTGINKINDFVYENINNGVYRCGFATSQQAYEEAYKKLFAALDEIELILQKNRYLLGKMITEADWRLFTTLIRFDMVYYSHFKCNQKRINDYPAISNYLRELYQWPGIAETVNAHHIKRHYYFSQTTVNPTQIVPLGPEIDFLQPHNRNHMSH